MLTDCNELLDMNRIVCNGDASPQGVYIYFFNYTRTYIMKHNSFLTYRFKNTSEVHKVKFKVYEDLDSLFTILHGCFFHPSSLNYAVITKEVTS